MKKNMKGKNLGKLKVSLQSSYQHQNQSLFPQKRFDQLLSSNEQGNTNSKCRKGKKSQSADYQPLKRDLSQNITQSSYRLIENEKKPERHIDNFLKIARYLKKIEASEQYILRDKSNPYNFLTPSVFWFLIEADYFSTDYFVSGNEKQYAQSILQKVRDLPVTLHSRLQEVRIKQKNLALTQSQMLKSVRSIFENLFQQKNASFVNTKRSHETTTTSDDTDFILSVLSIVLRRTKQKLRFQKNQESLKILESLKIKKSSNEEQKFLKKQESRKNDYQEKNQLFPPQKSDIPKQINEMISQKELNQEKSEEYCKINDKYQVSGEMLTEFFMNLPLDLVITILEQHAVQESKQKIPQIINLKNQISGDDLADIVTPLYSQDIDYLNYVQKNQGKHSQRKESYENNDSQHFCQICLQPESNISNSMIVCSKCRITVHKQCIGLNIFPIGEWICDVCTQFGPAGINLPCPLCSCTGGLMKKTSLTRETQIFKNKNPSYHRLLHSMSFQQPPKRYDPPMKKYFSDKKYYDYFKKETYPKQKPNFSRVWVHYSCAYGSPECEYRFNKKKDLDVFGMELIDQKKFLYVCDICKKQRAGPCIKCQESQCSCYFHAECAQRKKMYLYPIQGKTILYCRAHEPNYLLETIEGKRKNTREQIFKFCKVLQKYIKNHHMAKLKYKLPKLTENKKLSQKKDCSSNQKIIFEKQPEKQGFIINLKKTGYKSYKVTEKDVQNAPLYQDTLQSPKKSISIPQIWPQFKEFLDNDSVQMRMIEEVQNNENQFVEHQKESQFEYYFQ